MDYNEYAAIEIMGWRKEDGGFVWYTPDGDAKIDDWLMTDDSWHPDTDRNQLWLVIEKIGEKPDRIIQRAGQALRESRKVSPGRRSMQRLALFKACMTDPKLALKAICEAHKAGRT